MLPQQPTAIKGFNGRIYAFTTSRFYKIEPNNMYIEDTYEGAGCLSNQSVIVTDDGMFLLMIAIFIITMEPHLLR